MSDPDENTPRRWPIEPGQSERMRIRLQGIIDKPNSPARLRRQAERLLAQLDKTQRLNRDNLENES